MGFQKMSKVCALLARDYAEDFLRLLVKYQDISASEAAARLSLHTTTTQDFLEQLSDLGIVEKKIVHAKKRPYFRYSLKEKKIAIEFDLSLLYDPEVEAKRLKQGIREKKNSVAVFSAARGGEAISSVSVFTGKGRGKKERKIGLTDSQGKFLYHLPFPTADAMTIAKIMEEADIDRSCLSEILDIVDLLREYEVIEVG